MKTTEISNTRAARGLQRRDSIPIRSEPRAEGIDTVIVNRTVICRDDKHHVSSEAPLPMKPLAQSGQRLYLEP
jgi:hypothetical protein